MKIGAKSIRALLYTAIIMPVRLAFIDNPIGWVVVDWIMDGVFMADICVNFFTAYFDAEDSLVTSKKVTINIISIS